MRSRSHLIRQKSFDRGYKGSMFYFKYIEQEKGMGNMDQAKKEKLRDFFNQFFDDADNDDTRLQEAKEKLKKLRKKLRRSPKLVPQH